MMKVVMFNMNNKLIIKKQKHNKLSRMSEKKVNRILYICSSCHYILIKFLIFYQE
jgi:hypothetical protein